VVFVVRVVPAMSSTRKLELMRKIAAAAVLVSASGLAHADDSWQPQSWAMKGGTVMTVLAGWELTHFPDSKAGMLMVGKSNNEIAVVTDYPDSVEIRAFIADSGEFITVRDKNHDRRYEEIEGLEEGTVLKLDGSSYKLTKVDGKWSLTPAP
jgi:hypothetical protein